MRLFVSAAVIFVGLTACQPQAGNSQEVFVDNLSALCGQTLTGQVVSQDEVDADWRKVTLTVGPIDCGDKIAMPLAVGADQSRTWFITQSEDELTLKHRHTLKDGYPDPVTHYGGTTATQGTATRQDFPVDQYSIDMFLENGLNASVTNVWSLEIKPGEVFAYELNREGRHFRAEFPLK